MRTIPYWRLSGFYFFYFAFVGAMSPYWGLYLKSLEFNAFQIGVLMSLLQVMRIFGPNAWGWLADHLGRRVLIVQIAVVASLASYVGVFFGNGFLWLFAVMSLMSFFWSASLPLVEATTLSHLGDSTWRYGRIRLWGSVGFIVAVVGLGYLLDSFPIRLLLFAVLGVLAGMALFARRIPEAVVVSHDSDLHPVWHILRRPEVLAFFGGSFLMALAHGPYYIFYSIYLVDHGYTKSAVGLLWALGVVSEIGVFVWMPRLLRRVSLRKVLLASLALAVVRFLAIGWGVGWLALVVAAQVLHAATFGAYHSAAMEVVHRLFRGKHQAKGQGLYNSVSFGAGGTLGGLFSGYAWETAGPEWTFTVSAACALAGLALVAWKLKLPAVKA
ncbi:MAG: MFS transporter [Burkholderiales bacterium]